MNKKGENKSEANKLLLVVLSLLFCFTLYITLNYVNKYYTNKMPQGSEEILELKTKQISASIINDGRIEKIITKDSFIDKNEIIVENINSIKIVSNEEKENIFKINVRYNILKNNFNSKLVSSNKSEVLVRFSYSYDKENWTYINNAITTNISNITPLIGNNYDIAGLVSVLNVATNFEITAKPIEKTIMYWRSETIFQKSNKIKTNEFSANFTIEH